MVDNFRIRDVQIIWRQLGCDMLFPRNPLPLYAAIPIDSSVTVTHKSANA